MSKSSVNAAVIGLGNVGSGTLDILAKNRAEIERKLGFPLRVTAVASRAIASKPLPEGLGSDVFTTADWREAVARPDVDIVVELIGGTTVAREVIETAIAAGKSVITANKELMAAAGVDLWKAASDKGVAVAMEASVAGGIPVHDVLREGIASDRIQTLYGILNGTSNYILTEIEKNGSEFGAVLAEAQRLGYAEADPTADVDGFDARSKLALLSALAFGERVPVDHIFTEGIRRITPLDFDYAHRLDNTIRLICSARRSEHGLLLSVRPSLIPRSTILASVQGAYNAVWIRGEFGQDTFYYGRGAGPHPTGVAVVSDLMRVARDLRGGNTGRVSPFSFRELTDHVKTPIEIHKAPYYLRFKVQDQPGIIAKLAAALAEQKISIEAVLQLPSDTPHNLPFVITVEPTTEQSIRQAIASMSDVPFFTEAPLALPMEKGL
ncbi:homoserine dehydrogenase [Bryobacterales bacterium F-183]|nr:homoserine dehydrogenase [Bryobacterales bacterium F-183]